MAFILTLTLALLATEAGAQTFYESNPTYQDSVNDDATWVFHSPAQEGLAAARLELAAGELGKLPYTFSLLVVRHDALVFERYFHGSGKHASNNVHSASKSILSAAIGIAMSKGLLKGPDQFLGDLLPGAPHHLQLRHLLTMTAGIEWTEDETENDIEKKRNWVDAILRLPFHGNPGEKYHYSTGLTHLLSAALSHAADLSTAEFTQRNLFNPLGIKPQHWGARSPGHQLRGL